MFKKFFALFDSVDTIQREFEIKLERTVAVQKRQEEKAQYLRSLIYDLEEEEGIYNTEAKRASDLAKKIKAFLV